MWLRASHRLSLRGHATRRTRRGHPALTLTTHRTCPEDPRHRKKRGAPRPAWPGRPLHGGAPETGPHAEILSALGPGGVQQVQSEQSRAEVGAVLPSAGVSALLPVTAQPLALAPQVWGRGALNPQSSGIAGLPEPVGPPALTSNLPDDGAGRPGRTVSRRPRRRKFQPHGLSLSQTLGQTPMGAGPVPRCSAPASTGSPRCLPLDVGYASLIFLGAMRWPWSLTCS